MTFAKTLFVKVLTSYPGRCLAGSHWSIVIGHWMAANYSPLTTHHSLLTTHYSTVARQPMICTWFPFNAGFYPGNL